MIKNTVNLNKCSRNTRKKTKYKIIKQNNKEIKTYIAIIKSTVLNKTTNKSETIKNNMIKG